MNLDFEFDGAPRAAYAYTGGKPFDAARPTVVFVHGAMNDHSVWGLPARWFAAHGHAVLAVDLPGHGRSAGPVLTDVPAMARWVVALARAAGVRGAADGGAGAAFVGHSMGSLIALEAAAQAPDLATHLAMVGTAWPMKVAPALLALAAERPHDAIAMVNGLSIASLASKPSMPAPGMWLHGANRALMHRMLDGRHATGCAVNLFHHDFSVCDAYAGALDAASRVRCAATFVLGRRDVMTPPKAAAALAEALRARVETVDGSGHSLMGEAPDALLAALRRAIAAPPAPARG